MGEEGNRFMSEDRRKGCLCSLLPAEAARAATLAAAEVISSPNSPFMDPTIVVTV